MKMTRTRLTLQLVCQELDAMTLKEITTFAADALEHGLSGLHKDELLDIAVDKGLIDEAEAFTISEEWR